MNIVEYITSRSATIDGQAPIILIDGRDISSPIDALEAADTEDQALETPTGDTPLEHLFCAIEYTSAAGANTRRRITMLSLHPGPQALVLKAICHERKALRAFRTDRISAVIDQDGELHDTRAFFADFFGINLGVARDNDAAAGARRLRETMRPALSLLVAASTCDGEFHPTELDAIEQYVERELIHLVRAGKIAPGVGLDELNALRPMLRAMRPQRSGLTGFFRSVLAYEGDRFDRFVRALHAVVTADGVLRQQETDLIDWMGDSQAAYEREIAALRG